jgi:uncharacterized repeat protein (TIGR01451 family)
MNLVLFTNSFIFSQVHLEWINYSDYIGTPGSASVKATTVDAYGNVYSVGTFNGTIDFDPTANVHQVSSISTFDDAFIQKLDFRGNLIWIKTIAGSGDPQEALSISVDSINNVYIAGRFEGTADFDPGPGIYNLASSGFSFDYDLFVLKLDPQGNFSWARTWGNSIYDETYVSIDVDKAGYVYIGGDFSYSVDFDPGPDTFSVSALGGLDGYILKLSPIGNFVWVKHITTSGGAYLTSLDVGDSSNIYITGAFNSTTDFDPGPGTVNLTPSGGWKYDIFIEKLDSSGNFTWAKKIGAANNHAANDYPFDIHVDRFENVYVTGEFRGLVDFDPGPSVYSVLMGAIRDVFALKLDYNGDFVWVSTTKGSQHASGKAITTDLSGNCYVTGFFNYTVDFDHGPDTVSLISTSSSDDIFLKKISPTGDFIWVKNFPGFGDNIGNALSVDKYGNIFLGAQYQWLIDSDPSLDTFLISGTSSSKDGFVAKLNQQNVIGRVFLDLDQNCVKASDEQGLSGRLISITPGNHIATTSPNGFWGIDSLPTGNYTIMVDSAGQWIPTCPTTQHFTVLNSDSLTTAPSFGFVASSPCPMPDVSVFAPFLRPGFSHQKVYVQICNIEEASTTMNSNTLIIEFDSLLTVQSSSIPFTLIGNNKLEFQIDSLLPEQCYSFDIDCQLSINAALGQAICISAKLASIDSCSLDTIPTPRPTSMAPCVSNYDNSFLAVSSSCSNDTISFIIKNEGTGNMSCYSQLRLYIDGQLFMLDSINLTSGDSTFFVFNGDGRTWRMEVDQHPLLLGNSRPNSTIERCGNLANWTPGLYNLMPQDDADFFVDIFCGEVSGSYDPNDKTGFPLGLGSNHNILPNQDLEYLIRFQNTGTDTAFNVVIRDTLSSLLDIFSVVSSVSSHDYSFRIYGQRVLEWTFHNIMLPDSNINEALSHGFVTFKVNPISNLPNGSQIENTAQIYFDYNAPIVTNTYQHTIWTPYDSIQDISINLIDTACGTYTFNNLVYNNSGSYMQLISNGGLDTLINLNLQINDIDSVNISATSCDSFIYETQVYLNSGVFQHLYTNENGCDSVTTLNLTIDSTPSDSLILVGTTLIAIDSGLTYQWLDCDNGNNPISAATNSSYTPPISGNYAIEVTNGSCTTISPCYNVTIVNLASLKDKDKILIYPNPTHSVIYIEQKATNSLSYQLFNSLGNLVKKGHSQIPKSSIQLLDLASGVYYLSVECEGTIFNHKIIKL